MYFAPWDYFADPVLRAPTWGTLFMCIASSLMGVIALLKKRSLLIESLSHSTYPGALLALFLFASLFPQKEEWIFLPVFLGAFASSFLALKGIEWLEGKMRIHSDAALCFILASCFGGGVVVASVFQAHLPKWYQGAQLLLFGQSATMSDLHIFLYATLASLVALFLVLCFRPLQALLFDRDFAISLGIKVGILERAILWLLLISLIIGIRSVGVVLMSGMAIAPAVAARQFTDRLQTMFWLAALFGAVSGLLGNILAVEASIFFSQEGGKVVFATGPLIVLVGTALALFALAFAPKRGLIFRWARIFRFRLRCVEENILKALWKKGVVPRKALHETHRFSPFLLPYLLFRLKRQGWLEERNRELSLTRDGKYRAAAIIRLHRLWELYLASELGLEAEKVHHDAEEMEHILTPDLEKRLTRLLANPKKDPHQQPIPKRSSP